MTDVLSYAFIAVILGFQVSTLLSWFPLQSVSWQSRNVIHSQEMVKSSRSSLHFFFLPNFWCRFLLLKQPFQTSQTFSTVWLQNNYKYQTTAAVTL